MSHSKSSENAEGSEHSGLSGPEKRERGESNAVKLSNTSTREFLGDERLTEAKAKAGEVKEGALGRTGLSLSRLSRLSFVLSLPPSFVAASPAKLGSFGGAGYSTANKYKTPGKQKTNYY